MRLAVALGVRDALHAVGEHDEAARMLKRASATLQERADRISDPEVRASYLQNVPANLRVRALANQAG